MSSNCIETDGRNLLDKSIVTALRIICVTCFAMLFLLLTGNVFIRLFPVAAFFWFDEIVEWMFAWMVFFGAAALWARDDHFRLDWLCAKCRGTVGGHLLSVTVELLALTFVAIFFYQSLRLTTLAKDWTPFFNVPRACLYVCMPVSGAIMVGYSVRNVLRELRLIRTLRGAGGQ